MIKKVTPQFGASI